MLEKEIEKAVCAYAKSKGIDNYKFSSPARIGVPDRMFVCKVGRTFFIEFKRPGGKPTPTQDREAMKLTKLGFEVFLIDDVAEGKQVIDAQVHLSELHQAAQMAVEHLVTKEESHATKH